ncbi:MAG: glycosyltransferase [Erysipelotrichaceae bacterium]|nr:glycosyltransferase [Erysipelotrichaceae bacterium]
MIVTIIADVLGEENNGTTTACMNLVRYLTKCGDIVKIVCCDKDKAGKENYFIVPTYNFGRFLNNYVKKNSVSIAKPDEQIIENAIIGSDIIHVMIPFKLGRVALKFARKYHIPVSAGFHCQAENITSHLFLMNVALANHITYKNFYNEFYKYVDAIHYPTNFIKEVFENDVKVKTNAYVISNGVNDRYHKINCKKPDEFKDKFVILFIGRLSKEKSHLVLLNAVNLSKYKDNIQLIFAGDGPRKQYIIKKAQELNINPIIKFFSHDELVEVINYSDLYCHPAEIEIEAISCLEAISCGLVPLIANSPKSATKAFALTSDNLFDYNNPLDLAKKIDYWIEHPVEKEKLKQDYLGYTKQFNQEECMKKMRAMLEETIKKYRENEKNNIL